MRTDQAGIAYGYERAEIMKKLKSESKDNRKALIVTDKQLEVIKMSCELYGRIQLGQFREFSEIVTQTGFSGYEIRVQPERGDGETDEHYNEKCDKMYDGDMLVQQCIEGVMEGLYRHAYCWDGKPRTNEANVALDIWSFVDGRRDDGFHMGSEPLPKLLELDGDTWKETKK